MRRRQAMVLALTATALWSCGDSPVGTSGVLDLSREWSVAAPEDVGADGAAIAGAVDRARGNRRLLSLLAVKNGRLVVEEYFNGNGADRVNDVRSVTKSIVSALTGIAVARGLLDLDDPIGQYLHPDVTQLDPARQAITVRHLLTMTSGFEWDESGGFGSYTTWIQSVDHIETLVDQPLAQAPGTSFQYNSAAVHLLGVVLEEAVGMPLPLFAARYLFGPLGVNAVDWEPLTRGYVNGGSGIDLRPRDLARFGQLFLQGGRSGNMQVVPDTWVAASAEPRFSWRSAPYGVRGVTYGYLWWVVDGEPEPAFFAWGYGGQFIYVVPGLELVLVATTDWRGVSSDGGAGAFEAAALQLMVQELVPAFR